MRRNDLNSPKRIERQEIDVPTDDVVGATAYREFEELVILRIAAGSYALVHVYVFSLASQSRKKVPDILLIDIPPESLSVQDFVNFGKNSEPDQHISFLQCQIKRLTRF